MSSGKGKNQPSLCKQNKSSHPHRNLSIPSVSSQSKAYQKAQRKQRREAQRKAPMPAKMSVKAVNAERAKGGGTASTEQGSQLTIGL